MWLLNTIAKSATNVPLFREPCLARHHKYSFSETAETTHVRY